MDTLLINVSDLNARIEQAFSCIKASEFGSDNNCCPVLKKNRSTMLFYILDDAHDPVPVTCAETWGLWMSSHDIHVADDVIDEIRISTVFLGLDHNHREHTNPILFETMIFTAGSPGVMERYRTWDDAQAGHALLLKTIQSQKEMAQLVTIDSLSKILVDLRSKKFKPS